MPEFSHANQLIDLKTYLSLGVCRGRVRTMQAQHLTATRVGLSEQPRLQPRLGINLWIKRRLLLAACCDLRCEADIAAMQKNRQYQISLRLEARRTRIVRPVWKHT